MPPPWLAEEGTAEGEDCRSTRCCSQSGLRCYERDEGWATCRATCSSKDEGNHSKSSSWTCTALGPRTGATAWGSPSFFCFSILQATGYEPGLMAAQLQRKAGIFAA